MADSEMKKLTDTGYKKQREEENLLEGIEQDIEKQISELIRFPGGESGHLCSG